MFRFGGKSNASSRGDRKKSDQTSSSRRRAESVASSSTNRKSSRKDERNGSVRTSSPPSSRPAYPNLDNSSEPSSYATAPNSRLGARYEYTPSARPQSLTESAIRTLSTPDDDWVDLDARSEQRSRVSSGERRRKHRTHRSRSDSRERDTRSERRDRSDKASEVSRGKRRSEDAAMTERSLESPKESSRGYDSFNTQVDAPGFSQFPGQYQDNAISSRPLYHSNDSPPYLPSHFSGPYQDPLISPPPNRIEMSSHVPDQFPGQHEQPYMTRISPPHHPEMSSHIQDQFPGQDPEQYSAGAFGLAADYYGDQGQSVSHQPGIRPESATIITGAQPHLMAASAIPNPPQETGNGAALDFYASHPDQAIAPPKPARPSQASITPSGKPIKPSKQSKPSRPSLTSSTSSSKPDRPSTAAAAASGAALGYVAGVSQQNSHENHHQSGQSSYYQQTSTNAAYSSAPQQVQHSHSNSEPVIPTSDPYYAPPPPSSRPSKPGKQSSNSHNSLYAAGAAGLAAGAYAAHQHDHQQQHQHQHHQHHQGHNHSASVGAPPSSYGRPSTSPFVGGNTAMQYRQRGPISRLVDWWRDHEDVRKMEEYTEYIGVCRYCFDPRTSPADAPRPHNYNSKRSSDSLRRRSSESLRRANTQGGKHSRVDKESRYYSSDNERRNKRSSWIGAGLAGYGLGKLWESNRDFDDTYSVKSGRRSNSSRLDKRSDSADRKSNSEWGVLHNDGTHTGRDYIRLKEESVTRKQGLSNGSRTASMDRKSKKAGTAAASAFGASVTSYGRDHSKDRSSNGTFVRRHGNSHESSPRGSYIQRKDRSRSRSHSPGLGEILGLTKPSARRDRRQSPSAVSVGTSRMSDRQSEGAFSGRSSQSEHKRKEHRKKKKGFFSFGNSSSSSANSDLAFGTEITKPRQSSRKDHKNKSDEHLNATLLGIGATAAALAAAKQGSKNARRRPEVVPGRENRNGRTRQDRRANSTKLSEEEDGWESASEYDDTGSVASGLAFGDFDAQPRRRSSMDSLTSQSSGTSKWGWRWGSKSKKKHRSPTTPPAYPPRPEYDPQSFDRLNGAPPPVSTNTRMPSRVGSAMSNISSAASMPPMQYVHPVSTDDPTAFDVAGNSSMPGAFPLQSPVAGSRPGPAPLQQPQPITPIQPSVYSIHDRSRSRSPYTPPSGSVTSGRPVSIRRTQSSPITSHFARDVAVAGMAAAATTSILSTNKSKAPRDEGSAGVRFDLTEKQARKEEREHRREMSREDEERKRIDLDRVAKEEVHRHAVAESQRLAEEAAEQRRLIEETMRKEVARRVEQELQEERERLETAARKQAQIDAEAARHWEEERRRRDMAAAEARVIEDERLKAEEFYQLERERYEHEREIERRALERERRLDAELEQRSREDRARHSREPEAGSSRDAWNAPLAAAMVGAASGAAIADENERHKERQEDSRSNGTYETRAFEPSQGRTGRPLMDDDLYDPQFFQRKRSPSDLDRDRRDTANVITDLEDKYKQPTPSPAAFFAPKELSDSSKGKSAMTDPIGDNNVQVYRVPQIDLDHPPNEPPPPYQSSPLFPPQKDSKSDRTPWPIPELNVIAPTPPVSYAGSTKSDKSPVIPPTSPVVEPLDERDTSDSGTERRKSSRVSWGQDQTRVFEVPTPDSFPEQFISNQELNNNYSSSREEEFGTSPQHGGRTKNAYETDNDPSSTRQKARRQDSVEEIVREDGPTFASESFAREPFFARGPGVGLGLDSPGTEGAPPVQGFVEGEVDEPTPVIEKVPHIPGGFDDIDDKPSNASAAIDDVWAPLSKKEKKKREKAAKRMSMDDAVADNPPAPEEPTQPEPQREPEFEMPLSKKEKKKREKAPARDVLEELTPIASETSSPQHEIERDFEVPLSKKEQKKLEKAMKSQSTDVEPSPLVDTTSTYSVPPEIAEAEDDYSSLSKKEKKRRDKAAKSNLGEPDSIPSSPVTEGPAVEASATTSEPADDYFLSKKDKKKRDRAAARQALEYGSAASTPLEETSDAFGHHDSAEPPFGNGEKESEKRLTTPGSFEDTGPEPLVPADEPFPVLPADEFEMPLTAKEKKKRAKEAKRSGIDDFAAATLVGGAAATALASISPAKSGENDADIAEPASVKDVETPKGIEGDVREERRKSASGNFFDEGEPIMDAKKLKKKSKRNSGFSHSPTAASPLRSEVTWDDYVGSGRGESEPEKARDIETTRNDIDAPDQVPSQDLQEDAGITRHTDFPSPDSDRDLRSVVSAPVEHNEDSKRHKSRRSRHEGDDEGSARRSRSVAASEPADVYESSKKHKRRSKRESGDSDDNVSVVSTSSVRTRHDNDDDDALSMKGKKEKKGGIFSLFRRKSSDTAPKSQELEDELGGKDSEKKHKRHHRRRSSERDPYNDRMSSASRSRHRDEIDVDHKEPRHSSSSRHRSAHGDNGTPDDNDDTRSQVSESRRKHKHRHRDDSQEGNRSQPATDDFDDSRSQTSESRRKHRHRHSSQEGTRSGAAPDDFDDTVSQTSESKRKHRHRHESESRSRSRPAHGDRDGSPYQTSESSRRHKSRHRDSEDAQDSRVADKKSRDAEDSYYKERDQSFLGKRVEAEELPPLPASSQTSPTLAPQSAELPSFPSQPYTFETPGATVPAQLITTQNDNNHTPQKDSPTVNEDSEREVAEAVFAPLPPSGPSSPTEAQSGINLLPLPGSSPISPLHDPHTPKRPMVPLRPSSSTSVPLRFRRPLVSPSEPRERSSSFNSATFQSPASPTTPKAKQARPHSTEFKHSTEFRPLWLLERNPKPRDEVIDESLPSLPSSRNTSRSSSYQGSEAYESAVEDFSPDGHETRTSEERNQLAEHGEDVLGSQQTTPKASEFPPNVLDARPRSQPEYYSWSDVEREGRMHEKEAIGVRDTSQVRPRPADDGQNPQYDHGGQTADREAPELPAEKTRGSWLGETLGAALAGVVGGVIAHKEPAVNNDPMATDIWGDDSDGGDPAQVPGAGDDYLESFDKPTEPPPSDVSQTSSSKKGKKGKKGKLAKLGTASISEPTAPVSVEEIRNRRRRDTEIAVGSWFNPEPSGDQDIEENKEEEQKQADIVESSESLAQARETPLPETPLEPRDSEFTISSTEPGIASAAEIDTQHPAGSQARGSEGEESGLGSTAASLFMSRKKSKKGKKKQKSISLEDSSSEPPSASNEGTEIAAGEPQAEDTIAQDAQASGAQIDEVILPTSSAVDTSTVSTPLDNDGTSRAVFDSADLALANEDNNDSTVEVSTPSSPKAERKKKGKKGKKTEILDEETPEVENIEVEHLLQPETPGQQQAESDFVTPKKKGKKGKKNKSFDVGIEEPAPTQHEGSSVIDEEKVPVLEPEDIPLPKNEDLEIQEPMLSLQEPESSESPPDAGHDNHPTTQTRLVDDPNPQEIALPDDITEDLTEPIPDTTAALAGEYKLAPVDHHSVETVDSPAVASSPKHVVMDNEPSSEADRSVDTPEEAPETPEEESSSTLSWLLGKKKKKGKKAKKSLPSTESTTEPASSTPSSEVTELPRATSVQSDMTPNDSSDQAASEQAPGLVTRKEVLDDIAPTAAEQEASEPVNESLKMSHQADAKPTESELNVLPTVNEQEPANATPGEAELPELIRDSTEQPTDSIKTHELIAETIGSGPEILTSTANETVVAADPDEEWAMLPAKKSKKGKKNRKSAMISDTPESSPVVGEPEPAKDNPDNEPLPIEEPVSPEDSNEKTALDTSVSQTLDVFAEDEWAETPAKKGKKGKKNRKSEATSEIVEPLPDTEHTESAQPGVEQAPLPGDEQVISEAPISETITEAALPETPDVVPEDEWAATSSKKSKKKKKKSKGDVTPLELTAGLDDSAVGTPQPEQDQPSTVPLPEDDLPVAEDRDDNMTVEALVPTLPTDDAVLSQQQTEEVSVEDPKQEVAHDEWSTTPAGKKGKKGKKNRKSLVTNEPIVEELQAAEGHFVPTDTSISQAPDQTTEGEPWSAPTKKAKEIQKNINEDAGDAEPTTRPLENEGDKVAEEAKTETHEVANEPDLEPIETITPSEAQNAEDEWATPSSKKTKKSKKKKKSAPETPPDLTEPDEIFNSGENDNTTQPSKEETDVHTPAPEEPTTIQEETPITAQEETSTAVAEDLLATPTTKKSKKNKKGKRESIQPVQESEIVSVAEGFSEPIFEVNDVKSESHILTTEELLPTLAVSAAIATPDRPDLALVDPDKDLVEAASLTAVPKSPTVQPERSEPQQDAPALPDDEIFATPLTDKYLSLETPAEETFSTPLESAGLSDRNYFNLSSTNRAPTPAIPVVSDDKTPSGVDLSADQANAEPNDPTRLSGTVNERESSGPPEELNTQKAETTEDPKSTVSEHEIVQEVNASLQDKDSLVADEPIPLVDSPDHHDQTVEPDVLVVAQDPALPEDADRDLAKNHESMVVGEQDVDVPAQAQDGSPELSRLSGVEIPTITSDNTGTDDESVAESDPTLLPSSEDAREDIQPELIPLPDEPLYENTLLSGTAGEKPDNEDQHAIDASLTAISEEIDEQSQPSKLSKKDKKKKAKKAKASEEPSLLPQEIVIEEPTMLDEAQDGYTEPTGLQPETSNEKPEKALSPLPTKLSKKDKKKAKKATAGMGISTPDPQEIAANVPLPVEEPTEQVVEEDLPSPVAQHEASIEESVEGSSPATETTLANAPTAQDISTHPPDEKSSHLVPKLEELAEDAVEEPSFAPIKLSKKDKKKSKESKELEIQEPATSSFEDAQLVTPEPTNEEVLQPVLQDEKLSLTPVKLSKKDKKKIKKGNVLEDSREPETESQAVSPSPALTETPSDRSIRESILQNDDPVPETVASLDDIKDGLVSSTPIKISKKDKKKAKKSKAWEEPWPEENQQNQDVAPSTENDPVNDATQADVSSNEPSVEISTQEPVLDEQRTVAEPRSALPIAPGSDDISKALEDVWEPEIKSEDKSEQLQEETEIKLGIEPEQMQEETLEEKQEEVLEEKQEAKPEGASAQSTHAPEILSPDQNAVNEQPLQSKSVMNVDIDEAGAAAEVGQEIALPVKQSKKEKRKAKKDKTPVEDHPEPATTISPDDQRGDVQALDVLTTSDRAIAEDPQWLSGTDDKPLDNASDLAQAPATPDEYQPLQQEKDLSAPDSTGLDTMEDKQKGETDFMPREENEPVVKDVQIPDFAESKATESVDVRTSLTDQSHEFPESSTSLGPIIRDQEDAKIVPVQDESSILKWETSERTTRDDSHPHPDQDLGQTSVVQEDPIVADTPKHPDQDIEFAATVAAGLSDSGFNPDLVVEDPIFHRRSSPPGLAEADPEERFPATTKKKKGKKAKKGQSIAQDVLSPEPVSKELLQPVEKLSGTSEAHDDYFSAALSAGLAASGFASNVLDDHSTEQNKSIDEPEEISFAVSKKKKKGKKGKQSLPQTPAATEPIVEASEKSTAPDANDEPSVDTAPIELATSEAHMESPVPEIFSEQVDPARKEAWAMPNKKKGKKGKQAQVVEEELPKKLAEPKQTDSENNSGNVLGPRKDQSKFRDLDAPAESTEATPLMSPTSRVANLFPNLPRVKRRTHSTIMKEPEAAHIYNLDTAADHGVSNVPEASQSIPTSTTDPTLSKDPSIVPGASQHHEESLDLTPIDTGSPSPEILRSESQKALKSEELALPAEFKDQPSNPDQLRSAQPTWSFDNLQDSGLASSQTPIANDIANESSSVEPDTELSRGQHAPGGQEEPIDPLRVSIEVGPGWDLPVQKQRKKKIEEDSSTVELPQSQSESAGPPSPVESTTKDRTSYLFRSPPEAVRDSILVDKSAGQSPLPKPIPETPEPTGPRRFGSLHPIDTEQAASATTSEHDGRSTYVANGSPAKKKNRATSDVGSPEQGVKAARQSLTPLQSFRERVQSGPSEADPFISTTPQIQAKLSFALSETESPSFWPPTDDDYADRNLKSRRALGDLRSMSAQSDRSALTRASEQLRSPSATSHRSITPNLRRIDRSVSGDLRAASRRAGTLGPKTIAIEPPPTPPLQEGDEDNVFNGPGSSRAADMSNVYEGWGDVRSSSMSPTRPPSMRKRQSMHIIDLEARLDQLVAENNQLHVAKSTAEQDHQDASSQNDSNGQALREALDARDSEIRDKDGQIQQLRAILEPLQQEVARLTELNGRLYEQNKNLVDDTNNRYATLQAENTHANQQWEQSTRELENLKQQHAQLAGGMEDIVRQEIAKSLEDKKIEINRLKEDLAAATEQIRALQSQILASKTDDFLTVRDEDYFDTACQKLCQHVQQWILRFSKYSDNRMCRLTSDIADEKIEARLDNTILDGTDVDKLLADRVRRRDIFMSVVMSMIWEYVFTRYLFGMDREQRQKLKALEKILAEVGPQRAVSQWRATTLTLLSQRPAFATQRNLDTEAVAQEIFSVLSTLLPPPAQMENQILGSLRNVLRLAVDLSIEMRTQRAEFIMLPPLQPEWDAQGDLVRKVHFNASLMNERSGEYSSNDELHRNQAVVKIVLFPLVVKKGNDIGEGDDEIVVCPAQVLVSGLGPRKKVVRVMSGAMDIDEPRRSKQSLISGLGMDSNVV